MKLSDKIKLTERTHLMLSKEMKEKVVSEAESQGVAISEIIRIAVGEYFEKKGK